METFACRYQRLMVLLSVFLFALPVEGCKDDDAATAPAAIPSAAGHWVGTAHADWGGAFVNNDYSITADITQTGYSLAGSWVWTVTTPGVTWQGRRTRYVFKGQITTSNVITLAETSFVAENWQPTDPLPLLNWTAKLCAKGDTISCSRVLPSPEQYPITTAVLVKQ